MTLQEAIDRAERAEAKLAKAREILFAYGEENDGTADPWWAVLKRNRMGEDAIVAGPFFSRDRAAQYTEARAHDIGKTIVYCFSGHGSWHYRELREVLKEEKRMADPTEGIWIDPVAAKDQPQLRWFDPSGPVWEYQIIEFSGAPKPLATDLNELGNFGWEIFQVTQELDHWKLYCRRIKAVKEGE